ncbi:MAG TPA: sugar transferase [Petrimonas sp.]|nr:sugar transferase [Petrimonas sp.]
MYRNFIKPFFDFLISITLLLVLSPIFLVLIIVLTLNNSGKPFFFQTRPGKNARLFKVIKFKTMNDKKDVSGTLLPPAQRITSVGRFIRSTSLDEIPQLLNVIKGDMSLVGPRPLRVEYLPLYSAFQARRHEVKPGITGWAQVNGRNSLTWEEKFKLDVWYVDNQSLWLDLKILFLTFWKVIARKDINTSNEIIMEPFKGAKLDG